MALNLIGSENERQNRLSMKRFFNKIYAVMRLTRIYMSIMIGWAAITGLLLTKAEFSIKLSLLVGISELLIAMGGFAINDYFDYEQDEINSPDAPIPSKQLSRTTAMIIGLICFISGLSLCCSLGFIPVMLANLQTFILMFYSAIKRYSGIGGNLTTAFLIGSSFIYGASAVVQIGYAWFPAILATLFMIGREIAKDIPDIPGDQKVGIYTIPMKYGAKETKLIVAIISALSLFIAWLPIIFGKAIELYILLITIVTIIISISIYFLLKVEKNGIEIFLNSSALAFIFVLLSLNIGS